MKKLKKERKKFNRDYLRPLVGCGILFVLIVVFMIIFGYNPTDNTDTKQKTDNYHLNLDDSQVGDTSKCDSTFYKSIIDNINKIDVSFKVSSKEGEQVLDEESSSELGKDVYVSREYYAFNVSLNNLPDQVKIVVTDNKTENVRTLTKSESIFETLYTNEIVTYDVKVYGDVDSCKEVLLREFTFNTPYVNLLSELTACENNDDKNCNQVVYDNVDVTEISNSVIDKNKADAEKKDNNKSTVTIIIASIVIVLIVAIVIFIYFKRKRKMMVM